ncbi:hypothetical protein EB118_21615 [bacterium]|nr:hypothetical protein [bacterium]
MDEGAIIGKPVVASFIVSGCGPRLHCLNGGSCKSEPEGTNIPYRQGVLCSDRDFVLIILWSLEVQNCMTQKG